MVTKLWTPPKGITALKMPSYVKLDMAFGVGSGDTLFDKSRYRSHASIEGADWADGVHGKCLDFVAASTDFVEIAAAYDQLNFIAEDFSIIMRVRADALTDWMRVFTRGEGVADGYTLTLHSNGRINFFTFQGGAEQLTYSGAGDIVVATWYTIGVSRSGASAIIYKNGVAPAQTAGAHEDPATCARKALIGISDDEASFPFDGKIEFLLVVGGIALPASTHLAWHNALA